ncbi:PAS domain S-box protein [Paenibacillus sp. KR2-11]
MNFLGDITIFISPDYMIRNVNKSIFNFLQYTEEQLIGKPIGQILPVYDLAWVKTRDYQPFRDTEIVNQNGDTLPVAVSASTIRDKHNNLLGIWLLLGDVEGENHNRIPLRDLEQRYRAMTDHALDAVIVMNAEGRIIEWNGRAEVEFGWGEHEAVGRDLAELIIPLPYRQRHKQGLARFIENGEKRILNKRLELTALHRDGHEFPIELTVTPIEWGKSYLFSAFVRNITERKTAEKELILAKERAEAGARAKSEFLATISHEIRTPLNGIVGMTTLLKDTVLSPDQEEYIDYLVKSENALLSVINDVLDYSKIESGNIQLHTEPLELSTCILEIIDLLSVSIRGKPLEISYSVDTRIPATLVGDLGRLRQVLINLVGNAIKFTDQGRIHIEAVLLGETRGEIKLQISVQDTGIGVPKELEERLFEPFYQRDSSNTRKYGGTGLGLAISKKLVRLMGGEIWLEPTDGEGAAFSFTVVMERSGLPTDKQPEPSVAEEHVPAPNPVLKLLIAEDHRVNQRVLLKILEKLGYQADVATTGGEVLKYL